MSRPAGALAARIGPRPLLFAGPLGTAAGFLLLALPTTGGDYVTTFFPGILLLGLGMGLTVAPLTTAVMGAVDPRHAGAASGINNAVARAAGLLAIAGLGALLLARFNQVLDETLAPLSLPATLTTAIDAQRGRLGQADFSALPAAFRAPLRASFDLAYVAGFRTLMLACGGLAALGALAGLLLVEPRPTRLGARP
jgi:MFS family permease